MSQLRVVDNKDARSGEFAATYYIDGATTTRLTWNTADFTFFTASDTDAEGNPHTDTNIPVATINLQSPGSRRDSIQALTSDLINKLEHSSPQFTSTALSGGELRDTYLYICPALEHVINQEGRKVVNQAAAIALFENSGDIFKAATSEASLRTALTNLMSNLDTQPPDSSPFKLDVGVNLLLYVEVQREDASHSTRAARFYYTLAFMLGL